MQIKQGVTNQKHLLIEIVAQISLSSAILFKDKCKGSHKHEENDFSGSWDGHI